MSETEAESMSAMTRKEAANEIEKIHAAMYAGEITEQNVWRLEDVVKRLRMPLHDRKDE